MKKCPKCESLHDLKGIFCSRSCANSRGPRTEDFKNKVRIKLKGRKKSEATKRKISGDNNPRRRGINTPIQKYVRMCLYCDDTYETRLSRQRFCSKQCYSSHVRSNKSEFEIYRNECAFKFNIYDYPEEFDMDLLEERGFYSAANRGNNLDGVSRDHMISVKYGFDNNIDPSIISHPANCKLMIQRENSSKKTKCSLFLEELLNRIVKWNNKYGVVTER